MDSLMKEVIELHLMNDIDGANQIADRFQLGSNRAKRIYSSLVEEFDALVPEAIKLMVANSSNTSAEALLKSQFKTGSNRTQRILTYINTYDLQNSRFAKTIADQLTIETAPKEPGKPTPQKVQKPKEPAKKIEAKEKPKQHQFKSARGQMFCKFCGKEREWAGAECTGREHGHNFVLLKKDAELKPVCNKCGYDSSWSYYSCE